MNYSILPFPYKRSICYSGYRRGQMPGGRIPSYEEVKEDLNLLKEYWGYLRLYDCDPHAHTVLEVIRKENLPFKVMQGVHIDAEVNNFGCPWGGIYDEEVLIRNVRRNQKQIEKLAELANEYKDIINCLSIGNEASVEWTDHMVPVNSLVKFAKFLKSSVSQPITFCENYVPWLNKLKPLADQLDFISIHSYPVWEYKNIHSGLEYTKENYESVKKLYPNKPVIITEAGWATNSNGKGIDKSNVSQELQKIYLNDLLEWTDSKQILLYFFEAFDEEWKGSSHPLEPEKHWGLFHINRTPKLAMRSLIESSRLNQS